MHPNRHPFLFSESNDKRRLTSRQVHLRRLYDVLRLSIHRGDIERARRAWAILSRCKEVPWKNAWTLSLGLLNRRGHTTDAGPGKIEYLRAMMLQVPEERERMLSELVHLYILSGRYKDALDELEFSLPSFPYRDNAVLHIYAGICSVFMVQSYTDNTEGPLGDTQRIDIEMLDRAQIFFERAKALDPDNIVVDSLLNMAQCLTQKSPQQMHDSDEETAEIVEPSRITRPRTQVRSDFF